MYQAHYATALLLKSLTGPSIPSWPIFFGSSLLDILTAIATFLGLDALELDSTAGPYLYTNLVFIDWEHSLLMMLIWCVIFGWVYCHVRCGFRKEAAMLGAVSVVLHWGMDVLVVASSALKLYPHGARHFGMGLYEKYPVGSWVGENAYCVIASVAAVRLTKRRSGADISGTLLPMAGLCVLMSPWLSPLLLVARLYERGLLVGWMLRLVQMVGFTTACVAPALLLSRIVDRKERKARAVQSKGASRD